MVPRSNLGMPKISPISDVKVTGLVMEKLPATLGSLMVLYGSEILLLWLLMEIILLYLIDSLWGQQTSEYIWIHLNTSEYIYWAICCLPSSVQGYVTDIRRTPTCVPPVCNAACRPFKCNSIIVSMVVMLPHCCCDTSPFDDMSPFDVVKTNSCAELLPVADWWAPTQLHKYTLAGCINPKVFVNSLQDTLPISDMRVWSLSLSPFSCFVWPLRVKLGSLVVIFPLWHQVQSSQGNIYTES